MAKSIRYLHCTARASSIMNGPYVMICDAAHQKGGGGGLQVKSILSFVFDVLELFLSFKMMTHLSKLNKAFKILQLKKGSKISIFFIIF